MARIQKSPEQITFPGLSDQKPNGVPLFQIVNSSLHVSHLAFQDNDYVQGNDVSSGSQNKYVQCKIKLGKDELTFVRPDTTVDSHDLTMSAEIKSEKIDALIGKDQLAQSSGDDDLVSSSTVSRSSNQAQLFMGSYASKPLHFCIKSAPRRRLSQTTSDEPEETNREQYKSEMVSLDGSDEEQQQDSEETVSDDSDYQGKIFSCGHYQCLVYKLFLFLNRIDYNFIFTIIFMKI